MKKVILVIAVAAFAVGFSSCKKCTTCKVTDSNDPTFTYTYPEYCAKSADVNTFKTACQTTYSTALGYTVTCTDK